MIAILSFLILLAAIVYFFIKLNNKGIKSTQVFSLINNEFKESLSLNEIDTKKINSLSKIKSISLYLTLITFLLLLISSFLPTAFTGEHLSGIFLVIHVTVAPVFSVLLALVLLFYANNLKLVEPDFKNLENYKEASIEVNRSKIKLVFWLLSILSIPLLLSIIFILYPILGTDIQNINVIIHRLSALLFSILALMLIYFLISSRKKT